MSYLVSSVTHDKNPFLGGFPALMASTLIECCTLKIELFVFPLLFFYPETTGPSGKWLGALVTELRIATWRSSCVVWFVDLQHDICNRMARADA